MNTFIIFLGVLSLVAGIIFYMIRKRNEQVELYNEKHKSEDPLLHKEKNPIPTNIGKKSIVALMFLGIFLIFFTIANPFSLNDAGQRQIVQTIEGDLSVRFEPGLYWSGPFSKVTTYPNNVTIQVGPEEKKSNEADYWEGPHTATFSEGDGAKAGHTVKWDLPNKVNTMIELHTTYNNIDNLMKTTLLQYQKETMNYSTQRMSSEAHYSGGQSQLKDFFQDQLRNGQVLLVTETKTRKLENGTEKTYIEVNERRDSVGNMLRTTSDIQKYELTASFSSIDYISYDDRIYEKLKDKIDAASDEATAKQKFITAQQEALTAAEEGKKLLAETEARELAAKKEAVIRAEKEKEVAKERALQAKFTADKIEEEGRAQAAANRALVAAGLTPLEKAEWEYKTRVGIAAELAKVQMPGIVISGDGSGGANPLSAVGIKYLMDINDKLSK